MLTYIVRRIVYSVPVLIIASFLCSGASAPPTIRPRSAAHLARTRPASSREAPRARARRVDRQQWWTWLRTPARRPRQERPHRRSVSGMLTHASGQASNSCSGASSSRSCSDRGRCVLGGEAVLGRATTRSPGSRTSGSRCPRSCSGCSRSQFLRSTLPVTWFHLDQPIFYLVGLHIRDSRGSTSTTSDISPCPSLTLTVQSVAVVESIPAASMLDILNADYVRTARAKGVPQRKVIFKQRSATR